MDYERYDMVVDRCLDSLAKVKELIENNTLMFHPKIIVDLIKAKQK